MKYIKFTIPVLFLIMSPFIFAQDSIPGIILKGTNDYVEFFSGNMPLVISIPHGGYMLPDEIPERPCVDCAKHQDTFTIEIGLALREALFKKTGFYPFVIINNLHRTRLDPNRNITEAAEGNKFAEIAWNQFQNFIDSATADVQRKFGKGLYIDLHGHRHVIKRIELGYLLSSEELQLDDDLLNSGLFEEYSSIRNLIKDNINSLSYSELVRGKYSLGNILENEGYQCVPSPEHPFPKPLEPYFSGGYNTTRHGSASKGTIDGIQIELDEAIRSDAMRREKFANDLAFALVKYLKINYFPDSEFTTIKIPIKH